MKSNLLTILILSLLIISSFMVGRLTAERRSEWLETRDSVIIRDTLTQTILKDTTITKFVPRKVEVIKLDTIKENTVLVYEKKEYIDTLTNDADSLILSNTITGVDARLDSTHISWKKSNKVITNTIYITKEKPRKLITFSPQATAGYNPIDNKLGLVVGFGVSINF